MKKFGHAPITRTSVLRVSSSAHTQQSVPTRSGRRRIHACQMRRRMPACARSSLRRTPCVCLHAVREYSAGEGLEEDGLSAYRVPASSVAHAIGLFPSSLPPSLPPLSQRAWPAQIHNCELYCRYSAGIQYRQIPAGVYTCYAVGKHAQNLCGGTYFLSDGVCLVPWYLKS